MARTAVRAPHPTPYRPWRDSIMRACLTHAGLLCAGLLALAPGARADAPELTIFKQPNFAGEQLTLHGYTRDLAQRGFTDQASSLVVQSGRWQVCTQPDMKGDCIVP